MRKYPQLVISSTTIGADGRATGATADWFDYENFIRLGKSDIPKIIYDLEYQKNGAKFKSLYYDGEIPDKKTQSEADVSLCALIAFRTGPNPELIDTIFRQSQLYRPKWDRDTITPQVLSKLASKPVTAISIPPSGRTQICRRSSS